MIKLLGSFALAALTITVASKTARAEEQPIHGAFAVTYAGSPNTGGASYCDPTKTVLPIAVEAHGDGYSSLGPLSFSLLKGIGFDGTLHGCLTLTDPEGENLYATYAGIGSAGNANNFSPATGTLTFTGGTGRFHNATGTAKFTAYFANFYPASSFVFGGTAPIQGMAYYVVAGSVSIHED